MVLKWRDSGLSQAEFCRKHGIPEWSLSQWKRREERDRDYLTVRAKQSAIAERKTKRLEAKKKYWLALVEEQAASGLSITEFSRRRGIKANTLKRWRRGIKANTLKRWRRELLGVEQQVFSTARVRTKGKNPFVQVLLEKPAKSDASPDTQLEILLPGGGKVIATEQTFPTLLAKRFGRSARLLLNVRFHRHMNGRETHSDRSRSIMVVK